MEIMNEVLNENLDDVMVTEVGTGLGTKLGYGILGSVITVGTIYCAKKGYEFVKNYKRKKNLETMIDDDIEDEE